MPVILVPIKRPNGKLYCPRKLSSNAVSDDGGVLDGVIVLGTHDVSVAQPLADRYASWQLGAGYTAASPRAGWYRDGMSNGERTWITDEVRGRAGVWFGEIVEDGQ